MSDWLHGMSGWLHGMSDWLLELGEDKRLTNLFEEILELFLKFVYLILFIVVNIYI